MDTPYPEYGFLHLKQAEGFDLSSLGDFWNNTLNEDARNTIVGGLAGAGLGGLTGSGSGNILRNALIGGGIGGLGGYFSEDIASQLADWTSGGKGEGKSDSNGSSSSSGSSNAQSSSGGSSGGSSESQSSSGSNLDYFNTFMNGLQSPGGQTSPNPDRGQASPVGIGGRVNNFLEQLQSGSNPYGQSGSNSESNRLNSYYDTL